MDAILHSLSRADSFRVTAVESTEIGGAIGRIKADDPDVGRNAEMEYSIVGGHDIFNIITDQTTQEGVIIIKKVSFSSNGLFSHIACSCMSPTQLLLAASCHTAAVKSDY